MTNTPYAIRTGSSKALVRRGSFFYQHCRDAGGDEQGHIDLGTGKQVYFVLGVFGYQLLEFFAFIEKDSVRCRFVIV